MERNKSRTEEYKPVIKCNCIDETTKGYIIISHSRTRDEYMNKIKETKEPVKKELIKSQTDNLTSIIREIEKIEEC